MKIYIHIDELGRDAVVASALKRYFEIRGIDLHYGNRIDSVALKYANPFDALIFPNVDLLNSYLTSSREDIAPIYILPTESVSGNQHTKNRLMIHLFGQEFMLSHNSASIGRITKFFLWGDGHKKVMDSGSPELSDKFVKVGHPRHDVMCMPSKPLICSGKRKRLGLVTRFDLINVFDDRHNFESIFNNKTMGKPEEYWHEDGLNIEDRYFTNVQDFRIFLEIIELLRGEEYEISLRVHPRENYDAWKLFLKTHNLDVYLSPRWQPFLHWASEQDLIVAPPSTSFYDCAALNKMVISIGKISGTRGRHQFQNSDDFDPILEFFPQPESMKEFAKIISYLKFELDFSDNAREFLRMEVGFPGSKNSLSTLCDEVVNSLKGTCNSSSIYKRLVFKSARLIYRLKFEARILLKKASIQSAQFNLWNFRVEEINNLTKN